MDVFNNIAKQQNTQVNTEQQAVKIKPAPKMEVQTQTENFHQPAKSEVELRDLISTLNKALDPFNTSIRFGFDNSSDVFFVSVIDSQTNDTIRRFPAEQAESLVAKMHEIVGIIFDEKG